MLIQSQKSFKQSCYNMLFKNQMHRYILYTYADTIYILNIRL